MQGEGPDDCFIDAECQGTGEGETFPIVTDISYPDPATGTITFTANASDSDNDTIVHVEFWVLAPGYNDNEDWFSIGIDQNEPWSAVWDAANWGGSAKVRARAYTNNDGWGPYREEAFTVSYDCSRNDVICIGDNQEIQYNQGMNLNEEGATYVLMNNVVSTGAGFYIGTPSSNGPDNVVFDGNDFSITYQSLVGIGIGADSDNSCTVPSNCPNNIVIKKVNIIQNPGGSGAGIAVGAGSDGEIVDSTIKGKLVLFGSDNYYIHHNTFRQGITVGSDADWAVASNNRIEFNSFENPNEAVNGNAILFSRSSFNTFRNNTINYNINPAASEPGFKLNGATDTVIYNNFTDNIIIFNKGLGWHTSIRDGSAYNRFERNIFSTNVDGIYIQPGSGKPVHNNILKDNLIIADSRAVRIAYTLTTNNILENNLIYARTVPVWTESIGTNNKFIGNTIYAWAGSGFESEQDTTGNQILLRNNIFYSEIGRPFINTNPDANYDTNFNGFYRTDLIEPLITYHNTNYNTLSQYQQATGNDLDSISNNPLFVDISIKDFHLQENSPAIDAGTVIVGIHCPLSDDVDPNQQQCAHWKGLAPDMGAYEFTQ